jgi:hypothetical protein
MADQERKDGPETERGFGTGLREQLQRRRDRPAPGEPPSPSSSAASFVVTGEASSPPAAAPAEPQEPQLVEQLRTELAEALERERDLRTALEQATGSSSASRARSK